MVCFARFDLKMWLFFFVASIAGDCHALMLTWDPSPGARGYKLYYRTEQDHISTIIDVGNVTAYQLIAFNEHETHFVAATAYNAFGIESGFSDEIEYSTEDGYSTSDNCPALPNGYNFGSCVKRIGGVPVGLLGSRPYSVLCKQDSDCGAYETCHMSQDDVNGNTIGDACECYADIDGNGSVDCLDMIVLKQQFGTAASAADLNASGFVDVYDLSIMKAQFGSSGCPIL